MKAISLWEPWATAMAIGLKTNETRTWRTPVCKNLVICAARKPIAREYADVAQLVIQNAGRPIQFSFGFAVCIVDLIECVPTEVYNKCFHASQIERLLGDYSPGRWVWRTENLRRVRPYQVKGSQGLFSIPSTTPLEEW